VLGVHERDDVVGVVDRAEALLGMRRTVGSGRQRRRGMATQIRRLLTPYREQLSRVPLLNVVRRDTPTNVPQCGQ
jgi:hypothetical protein